MGDSAWYIVLGSTLCMPESILQGLMLFGIELVVSFM